MKKNLGLTLIEVVIATAILAAVLLIAFSVLWSTQSAYNEAAIAQDLEARGRTFVDAYKKDLSFARVTTIAADGSSVRYQVPLSSQASGDLDYGYANQGVAIVGAECELAFVPTVLYAEGTTAPPPPAGATSVALGGIDANADGDLSDVIAVGTVVKRIWSGAALLDSAAVSDQVALGYSGGSYAVDVDNDGAADRLFTVLDASGNVVAAGMIASSGVKFRMTVWHGALSDLKTRFVLRRMSDEWVLKNDQ